MLDSTTVLYPELEWEAKTGPLFDVNGNEVPSDIARGVYKGDKGELIGTCGKSTKLVQHRDVVDPILQELHNQKYEIKERSFDRHDLYDLKGHRGAFVSITTSGNGAVLKADVITGDFVEPTGPSAYMPDGPPTLFRRYSGLNSHNATYAAQASASYLNAVCMNGMVSTEFVATVKGKHTKGFSIDAFKAKILNAATMMEGDTARFEQYIKTPCTIEQAEEFFKRTIAAQRPDPKGNPQWSEQLVRTLTDLFVKEGARNVWSIYQAMTAWATHGDLRGNATALTARIGRDERVARSMRTNEFKELVAA